VTQRQRLESLKDLAGNDETEAARQLAASLEEVRAREAELEQLRGYMNEYRLTLEREGAVDAARWNNSRLFIHRLHDAISRREAELEQILGRRDVDLDRWRQSRGRTKAFAQLLDMHDRETRRVRDRAEQKELDELTSQRGI
jgi:flagellar protein FliJ